MHKSVNIRTDKMISVVVLTKNEEKNIEKCLKSVQFCNEIVIVDDNSIDKTLQLAKKYNPKIYTRSLEDFSSQRNFGLSKTKNEWVLFIDADEQISEELQKEILQSIKNNAFDGYKILRRDFLWSKKLKHGDVGNVSLLRLGKRSKGKWNGAVHEVWQINGDIGNLYAPLYHYPHDSISKFLSEINFYSTLRAQELFEQKRKSSIFTIVAYTKLKFFHLYFLKLGFLDGNHGLVHALMMSFYSFLVRGKLYFLNKK